MSSRKAAAASLIIPTLNEEANLPRVFADIRSLRRTRILEVIIVDGYSQDGTVRIARRNGARVIFDRKGKGSAIILGLRAARGRVAVIMDADCSHTADELPLLIDKVDKEGYDVCMGSRFMQGGRSDDITFLRYLGNKIFVSLVNLIWGTRYTDLCYGYRSFSKRAARRLRLSVSGFGIETQISIRCAKAGLRVAEVPSHEKVRFRGESRLRTFRDGFLILSTILKEMVGDG